MNIGNFGPENPAYIFEAPDFSGGRDFDAEGKRIGNAAMGEISMVQPTDLEIVSEAIDAANADFYGNERHSKHNQKIINTLKENLIETDDPNFDHESFKTLETAVVLHDFVAHRITEADETAAKRKMSEEEKHEMMGEAFDILGRIKDSVKDKDLFDKAVVFAIDAAKWEEIPGRSIRKDAGKKITELTEAGTISEDEAEIARLALNSDKEGLKAKKLSPEEVKKTLQKCKLENLDLEKIENGAHKHNIAGLIVKATEVLVNIKNPPKDNPASTWRDSIEAINVYAPALQMYGFKKLSAEIRGAALETQFDDPNGKAERQFQKSQQYFDEIADLSDGIFDENFGAVPHTKAARVKTKGSLMRKLQNRKKKYLQQNAEAPDGIGVAYILEEDMDAEEITYLAGVFVELMSDQGIRKIRFEHTLKDEDNPDNTYLKPRKSGYQAINLAFKYFTDGGPEEGVPFEVQFVTKKNNRINTYGKASHLFIEHDAKYDPKKHQPIFDRQEERAKSTTTTSPGLTVYSVAETASMAPEYNFVFNDLFKPVKVEGQPLCLVPPEIQKRAEAVLKLQDQPIGDEKDIVIMPPGQVTKEQFVSALKLLDVNLAENKYILDAIDLVEKGFADAVRDDGVTKVIEGHLLPTALMTAMYIAQSGIQWNRDDFKPDEFIANAVTAAILHDYVEDLTPKARVADDASPEEKWLDQKQRLEIRNNLLNGIGFKFGGFIKETVEALTAPIDIENELDRRTKYSQIVNENPIARIIKPLDRHGNHTTDLIKMIDGEVDPSSAEFKKYLRYFAKTDRHLSDQFTADDMPVNFRALHKIVWLLAEDCGYTKEASSRRRSLRLSREQA